MPKLKSVVSEEMVQKIICYPVRFGSSVHDTHMWRLTADGVFSVKSAYDLLFQEYMEVEPYWKLLWKMKIFPMLQIFLWLVFQGKVLSNDQRWKR